MFVVPYLVYSLVGAFGLMLGSYLNSWMWRVHENKRWGSRSVCVNCHRQLVWSENIPLASFIFLGGKCQTCKQPIPIDYFLIEFTVALGFFGLTFYHLHSPLFIPIQFFRDLFFFTLLTVVFVYDFKYQLILSGVVWSGALVAFVINHFYLQLSTYSLVLGMVIGGGFFLFQYIISRGRWIGGGDVRLGVMMGALLGWPTILVALFSSYVLGALVAIPLLIFKKKGMNSQIPFGTFLAVGTLVAMLWGNQIIAWYWGLLRW